MLFEEKVVNFLRPLRGTSGKAERQLFNHKRQMSMISNSDFEKLWVLYKTEGEPQKPNQEGFCLQRIILEAYAKDVESGIYNINYDVAVSTAEC